MSKTIPISYPPDNQGAYGGLHIQTPENLLDPKYFPSLNGFWLRNVEIRSTPPFAQIFPGPDNVNPSLGTATFMDSNGVIHSVAFTSRGLWQLNGINNTAANPWTFIGGPELTPVTPVSARAFANVLYYTNGGFQLLSWDGIAQAPVVVSAVLNSQLPGGGSGSGSIGGFFLDELAAHLILFNVVAYNSSTNTITNSPQEIWWSASGIPNQFDPSVNTSAGFNPFLEVPDIITGEMMMGTSGYIFRSNGITVMSPTGSGSLPFQFDHLWASKNGIGNVYPWSIAQYGSIGMFISTEQIYQVSIYSFQEIGGGARDAIMADLAAASSNPVANIIPSYAYGYIYLTYVIGIPLGTFTRFYFYSVEDKNWMPRDVQGLLVTGRPDMVWR